MLIIVLIGLLWNAGVFDGPLSNVGLNREICAENVFGNKMCGDELAAFCEDNYNPERNGDTCGRILRDRGIDPWSIVEREQDERRAYTQCIEREALREPPNMDACDVP